MIGIDAGGIRIAIDRQEDSEPCVMLSAECGHFEKVRGIVFGQMLDCVQTSNQGYTLQQVLTRIVGDLGVPVAFGVKSGHVTSGNITLPFGVPANLTVRDGRVALRILESAVTP